MAEVRRIDDRGRILLSREDLEVLGAHPGDHVVLEAPATWFGGRCLLVYMMPKRDVHA